MKYYEINDLFNATNGEKYHVVLDNIIYSLQRVGGASNYWEHVTETLAKDDSFVFDYIERTDGTGNLSRQKLKENNYLNDDFPRKHSKLHRRVDRYLDVRGDFQQPTIFHSPIYRIMKGKNCISVINIHDFTYHKYFKGPEKWINTWQQERAARLADVIVCCSISTKIDLMEYIPEIDEEKIEVVYHSFNNNIFFPRENIQRKKQVVFVGARTHYKNFHMAVDSVALNHKVELLIIGKPINEVEKKYLELKLSGRYSVFEFPSSEKIAEVFNESLALLYLSNYEGFGIPIIEAMATGLPVIAKRVSSIPEVAGNAGILLDECNPEIVSSEIDKLILSQKYFDVVSDNSIRQANLFSWDDSMTQLKQIYSNAIDKARKPHVYF